MKWLRSILPVVAMVMFVTMIMGLRCPPQDDHEHTEGDEHAARLIVPGGQ